MSDFDYKADDKKKVVPIGTDGDEYEPDDDDIPLEERVKKENADSVAWELKSGTIPGLGMESPLIASRKNTKLYMQPSEPTRASSLAYLRKTHQMSSPVSTS